MAITADDLVGINADDMVRTYGPQAYHAAMRLMHALNRTGCRQSAIRMGCVAVQLASAYWDQEPDLGPSPNGGPALTIEQQGAVALN
jgi:hypothetical protein